MSHSLFLHYGPGGSSYIENHELSKFLPATIFWNQPKVKTLSEPFKKLTIACTEQVLSIKAPLQLIGHSFGCDLIASILPQGSEINNAILISPLQSIPLAFHSLGEVLNKKEAKPELESALALALSKISDIDPATFWGMVGPIVTHPLYQSIFWQSKVAKENYDAVAAKSPAFDAEEWQTVIQDYIFNNSTDRFSRLNGKKVLAIFGDSDPYFKAERDLPFWQNLLGKNQVIVLKECGHFPHLEKKSEFIEIVQSWSRLT
ncbi:MAG: alpha/beta hydrolase [Bdellovibrionota bacterium]